MKKILIVLLMPLAIQAQTNWLEQNVNLQEADSNHVKVMVSGKAFELMSYAKPDSILTDNVMALAKSVHGMVGFMKLSDATIEATWTAARSNKSFEEYAKITRKGDQMILYVNQTDGVVNEAVMLVQYKEENMAMSIYGELDMRLFGELYKLVPHRYMHELQHEHEHGGDHAH